jgi:hypothetical protein
VSAVSCTIMYVPLHAKSTHVVGVRLLRFSTLPLSIRRARLSCLALFGLHRLKFNSHHINVAVNVWSIKCRLIACILTHIRSYLRDESIKPSWSKIEIFLSNNTKVLQCLLNFNTLNQTKRALS